MTTGANYDGYGNDILQLLSWYFVFFKGAHDIIPTVPNKGTVTKLLIMIVFDHLCPFLIKYDHNQKNGLR